jgi:ribosomal protein L34
LSISRTGERRNKREELAKLKHAALAELERRGYEVRGKTPAQIREILKRRPKKSRTKLTDRANILIGSNGTFS